MNILTKILFLLTTFCSRVSDERMNYLRKLLDDDKNYTDKFVCDVLKYCLKRQKRNLSYQFIKNIKQIYIGLGKESFYDNILPGIRELVLLGYPEVLYELARSIKLMPNLISYSKLKDMIYSKILYFRYYP